jgi:hypothetical protein
MDQRINQFNALYGNIPKPVETAASTTFFGIKIVGHHTVYLGKNRLSITKTHKGDYMHVEEHKFEPEGLESNDTKWFLSDSDSESDKDYAACDMDSCGYCGHCIY